MLTTAALMMFACVSTQAPTTATPKVGKPLVKRLPAQIEGVELVGGTVRAKSGYKFVQQANGSVTVARMAGGPAVGGRWECECEGPSGGPGTGECEAEIAGGRIQCLTGKCNGSCNLITTVGGLRKAIVMY
jgi:hypothetical protein